ncbi:MAG: hypothetical protein ACRD8U_15575 [Pyrinomonadaceae bacterium]
MKTVQIADFKSLEQACSELRESLFDLDTASLNSTQDVWEGKFIRPLEDPTRSETRKRFFFLGSVRYFPLIQTVLRIRKVKSQRVNDRARIGRYTFSEVRPTPTGCSLQFIEDMEIELDFERDALGELVDERLLDRRGYVKSFLLIESGLMIE